MSYRIKNSIKLISGKFWLLQSIQSIERLVYSALVLQMAVYIAQKDLLGGLHFDHTDKGIIFFCWALVQNLTPVISGGFSDKFGRKRVLIISILISTAGYFITGFQRDFYSFLFSVLIIGFGLGLYRPALYGLLAQNIKKEHSSVSWGLNVMLINLAVFFAPPLAKYLEGISWFVFFTGLSLILSLTLIPIFFVKDEVEFVNTESNFKLLKSTFTELFKPQIITIVIILSGFMTIYMQFYETLPNFIYDWVSTSNLAAKLNLPDFMMSNNSFGKMIDFKWLYNLNSGIIVLAVVPITFLIRKLNLTKSLLIGLSITTIGIICSGWSMYGSFTVAGMILYTFGEMITNPKFNEYMSKIAPENKKSMYMGFINFSLAIGLSFGSLIGGYLYKNYSEKSGLAIEYLQTNYAANQNIDHSNSLEILMEKTGTNYHQATQLLWDYYHPQYIWLVFGLIGIMSIFFLFRYSKKYQI